MAPQHADVPRRLVRVPHCDQQCSDGHMRGQLECQLWVHPLDLQLEIGCHQLVRILKNHDQADESAEEGEELEREACVQLRPEPEAHVASHGE